MPTPESAEAFAKLVAARTRLTEVTKLLNECYDRLSLDGQGGRQRYIELQKEWDVVFREFEAATDAFSATVKKLPELVTHRLPTSQNSH
jgi:hypothetical protein